MSETCRLLSMWGGVTVSLALKLRFDASMDDVDFTNLVKHLSDDRGQGLLLHDAGSDRQPLHSRPRVIARWAR